MTSLNIALAGNPNCGKTTLFNALTGSRQRVGNWPGVTVERIEGTFTHQDRDIAIVDLPGIYSFSAYSLDESIARRHILYDRPAVVVNILDATNLQRNLYLTTQLLEMKVPVVVALNMMDIARQRKLKIEVEHLARHLDCPVIPVVASKKTGLEELKNAIVRVADEHAIPATTVAYDSEVEKGLADLTARCSELAEQNRVDPRWLAIKLLEQDELAIQIAGDRFDETIAEHARRVERHTGEPIDVVIADGRYGFIHGLARDVVRRELILRRTLSDGIDRVMLFRPLGLPIFLAVMYGVFAITMNLSAPFIAFFDKFAGTIFVDGTAAVLNGLGAPQLVVNLLADGIGGGIQTVATFIPPIFLIFLCLAILEDSGYMARAAFIMDRLLRAIGLPGKAFLPLLVGFGCNVPAILATRTLENQRDRILTVMMNPFMSCGARLPVYALFAVVFFPDYGGLMVFSLYLTGIVLAILTGLLLKTTLLAGEPSTFVMELPPYHLPTIDGVLHHTWFRLKSFILRAGKVILVAVVILSLFNAVAITDDGVSLSGEARTDSLLAVTGRAITPAFTPMGVEQDNWPAAVGLFTGIFAKEAVAGTIDALYTQMARNPQASSAETDASPPPDPAVARPALDFWGGLYEAVLEIPRGLGVLDEPEAGDEPSASSVTVSMMKQRFDGRVGAYAYVLFVLIYMPCIAAIAAVYRETSLRWTVFCVGYLTLLAWSVATLFYQLATFTRHPGRSLVWIAVAGGILVVFTAILKIAGRRIRVRD